MEELLKKLQSGFNAYGELGSPISESDKTEYAQNNLRNYLVDLGGMPTDWKLTKADEKNYHQNLPELMGSGTMGTVGKAVAAEGLVQAPASRFGKLFVKDTTPNVGKVIMADGLPNKIIYKKK
jgi:hypothetical protein